MEEIKTNVVIITAEEYKALIEENARLHMRDDAIQRALVEAATDASLGYKSEYLVFGNDAMIDVAKTINRDLYAFALKAKIEKEEEEQRKEEEDNE